MRFAMLLIGIVALADQAGLGEEPFRIVHDPFGYRPEIEDIDRSGGLSEGDWVRFGRIRFAIGDPGVWKIRHDEALGRLYRVLEDGAENLIALVVDGELNQDVLGFGEEELRGLRGAVLGAWNQDIERMISLMDPDIACITIERGAWTGEKLRDLPDLPVTLKRLAIDSSRSPEVSDCGRLRSMEALVALSVSGVPGFDCSWLVHCTELQYLNLSATHPSRTSFLSRLKDLQVVDLSWNLEIEDVAFLAGLSQLRSISIARTSVVDLTSLGVLRKLQALDANRTEVESLPRSAMPALVELRVICTDLEDDRVAAFLMRNPSCAVRHRWVPSLIAELSSADRIVVRSGGPFDEGRLERVIFESKEVRGFLRGIEIVEEASGGHCFCPGSPTVSFYSGDQHLMALGVHHGVSLRCSELWPGDARLTERSAKELSRWLARRGATKPLEELLNTEGALAEALEDRYERIWEILPEHVTAEMDDTPMEGQYRSAIEEAVANPIDRAGLYLRMYGAHDGSWNLIVGFDAWIEQALLPSISEAHFAAVLTETLDDPDFEDPELLRGVARVIFDNSSGVGIDEAAFRSVFDRVAMAGLSSPRIHNRRRTLYELGKMKSSGSLAVLRNVATGRIKQVIRPQELGVEPRGWIEPAPDVDAIPEGVSDRALAARMLAQRRDFESRGAIEELLKTASKDDAPVLQEALEILEQAGN